MDETKLRAWWSHRQGLDGSLEGKTTAEVVERAGWSHSVGVAGPYFTLFSRAGTSREAADSAAAKLEIHELPTVRGCTYVVPADDFAAGLMAGGKEEGPQHNASARARQIWKPNPLTSFKGSVVVEPLAVVPAEPGSDQLLLAEDVDAFRAFKPPTKCAAEDAVNDLRRSD